MDRVVIVTGGTSGIGAAVVARLRREGCRVYEFSRRAAEDPDHFAVDVTDVNAVINIILKTKQATDYPGNADVTSDGNVDIADVNAVIDIMLGK